MNSEEDERQDHPVSTLHKRPPDGDNLTPAELKRRKGGPGIRDGGSSRTKLRVNDYTVGWICALHIEMAAAKCMLHNVHEGLGKSSDDSNTYIFGSICGHNIVIACLPAVGYGTNNAAIVASHMRRTFPSIRTFLMVGIGGGAPGRVDIRLGDVVVSTGVIQYDMGKTIQQGQFRATGVTRQPSPTLMTAVSAIRAHHEIAASKIPFILSRMREQYPSMGEYTDRESLQDFLFDSAYDHPATLESCADCDRSRLVRRPSRSNNNPVLHYGIIASGNQVMKHARTRDRVAEEFDAICFEMEAAGLMDSFQCLVIRGICDYSDSHKNKEWQKYASATAAAYTKELLGIIPTIEIETASNGDLLQKRRQHLIESLWFDKLYARHSNIRSAYGKTCAWLLSHPDYIGWLTPAEFPQHHGLLWIRGKPGAGKSTLMKYIYTRSLENADITISFFFNARGDYLEKSTEGMYRSLLIQLFEKLPDLQEILNPFCYPDLTRGKDFLWPVDALQHLFSAVIAKLGRRRITCFVDALDECGELQIRNMVEHFEQLGLRALETEGKLYICFSSRHYPTICVQHGRTLTLEDQPGHSQDLEKYVRSKLQAGKGKYVESIKNELLQKAAGVFMWVVLVVNILNEEFHRGRIFAVRKRLQETPSELSALFKDILRRDNKNMDDLLLCIQWILYAHSPLEPEQFYYAVVAGLDPENITEWDPQHTTAEDMKRFVSSSSKGLAEVTKSKAGTVQFIHESVRDFLLKDGGIQDLWPDLEKDFQSHSHDQLKECCYAYMKTDISKYVPYNRMNKDYPMVPSNRQAAVRRVSEKFPFLKYAISHVLYHANAAASELSQQDFLMTFNLATWINLDNLFEKFQTRRHKLSAPNLVYILAEQNLANLITCVHGFDSAAHSINSGERYIYPLFAALANRQREAFKTISQLENIESSEDVITRQLEDGRDFKPSDESPLHWAARYGHTKIAKLLVDKHALLADRYALLVNKYALASTDKTGHTPLMWAARNGHKEITLLLINNGADIELECKGRTPLLRAAENGHREIVKLLLDRGANIEATPSGNTPLSLAAKEGHGEVVKLLLDRGADVEGRRYTWRTPLSWAALQGHYEVVQLLLDRGANVKAKDNWGSTPWDLANMHGHTEIAELLDTFLKD